MAKTHSKPGPKPKYGERRDYHFRLTVDDGLADAFDAVAKEHGGDNAYIVQILLERPEIAVRLAKTGAEQIASNEAKIRDLELRVVCAKYQELKLWTEEGDLFTLSKGTAASTERWHLYTRTEDYYGDSIDEVLQQVGDKGYPVMSWLEKFTDH